MSTLTVSVVLIVLVASATNASCQDVVRLAAGARLTESDPPGTVIESTASFSNPSGSISGSLSATVSRAPANSVVTQTLRQSVLEANINNASLIISSNQDVEALAQGLQFDEELREETLVKSSDRQLDSDVVAIKAIAKSALETREVLKLAEVMVASTIGEDDVSLEAELAQLLNDRELMTAILNADPTKEFVPDEDLVDDEEVYLSPTIVIRSGEGRSSSPLARSQASAFAEGDGAVAQAHSSVEVSDSSSFATDDTSDADSITSVESPDSSSFASNDPLDATSITSVESPDSSSFSFDDRLDAESITSGGGFDSGSFLIDPLDAASIASSIGRRRRRLLCDACSPVNSFICAHCWPKAVCVKYAWCSLAARNSRRRRNRRRNRNNG